jgi:serine phosphatase RsbU (regulator of sigma subunit)
LPKDIISGDFPWVHYKNHQLYIAVVDCTGHGIPGAFLSVVAHFLLNEIVKSGENLAPSKILEMLHIYTKKTLRQHLPGVGSSDGADIALCKINLQTKELIFSGAHRPLLYINNNEIHEIKGDKQPIGGTHYDRNKKRLTFTDHKINMQAGDKFLIYSDGLTDQFGGPNTARQLKFGQSSLKKLLLKASAEGLNSLDTVNSIEKDFFAWKAANKQLDDVLMLHFGI